MRIIRHQIPVTDHAKIDVYGELISAAASRTDPNGSIDIWSVDHEFGEAPAPVHVFVIGTGNPIPPDAADAIRNGKFLGTIVTPSRLVWHVWQGRYHA